MTPHLIVGAREFQCTLKAISIKLGFAALQHDKKVIGVSVMDELDWEMAKAGHPVDTIALGSKKAFNCKIVFK